jgi:hypothetical protein
MKETKQTTIIKQKVFSFNKIGEKNDVGGGGQFVFGRKTDHHHLSQSLSLSASTPFR